MPIWMVNASWLGEAHIKQCKGVQADKMDETKAATRLGHDQNGIRGLINAEDREAALDVLTAYMVEHGDEI